MGIKLCAAVYLSSPGGEQAPWFGLLLVYLMGFAIEVFGVNTGAVFGTYEYGSGLGPKLMHTPLLIGLNWLMLVYSTHLMCHGFKINAILKTLFAALSMTLYDVVLEQVAPLLNMWHWENGLVPAKNYLAWLVVSFVMHLVFRISKVQYTNHIAVFLFIVQFVFFAGLHLVTKIY
ncbi:MAG: carotenoid biosynthesis protein [Bacteroidales bacterium]|nr:carotenoid biosynthesis protein [Bacteroidales bacterium]